MSHILEKFPKIKINKWIDVKPIHCHQRLPENTLVSKLKTLSKDLVFTEVKFKFIPVELRFFFDHKIDHLPGMLEISAMRQASLAVSHLVYGVPMDFIAILSWLEVKMYNYGELDKNIYGRSKLLNISKNPYRIMLDFDGIMLQEEYPVMGMKGKLIMFHPSVAEKFRYRKIPYKEKDWVRKWINR